MTRKGFDMTATFEVSATQVYSGAVDPTTIKYPLVLVRFAPNPELRGYEKMREWQIDVDGDLAAYLDFPEGTKGEYCPTVGIMTHNLMTYATPLMQRITDEFQRKGLRVIAVGQYTGSFGPSHLLREGIIYKRQ